VVKRSPKGMWKPEEIGPKLKELIATAPKREEQAAVIMSALS